MADTQQGYMEATVTGIQDAIHRGAVTSATLVQWYLARIEAIDRKGPKLQAIVNVNPEALQQAEALDKHFAATGKFKGPLHGVPVLVKDQGETSFVPTTFGSKGFEGYQPTTNATLVTKLMDAGAIILAKTSMCDFAAGWFSFSSVTDRTRNPYGLDRDAGGSSAGTGAGIAANLGLIGIGEDTGGSIRIPSSFNNLFGLRVTTGLISRAGFSPLLHFQDTPGPMARTVRDVAKLMDVLVGYDPKDPFTSAATLTQDAGQYESRLEQGGIAGVRIGVLKEGFGPDDDDSRPVNTVVRNRLEWFKAQGAELVEVSIPDVQDWIGLTSIYVQQSKYDLNRFMASRTVGPKRTFEEIYEKRWFHPLNDLFHNLHEGPSDPHVAEGYYKQRLAQFEFQRLIIDLFARNGIDFMMYPDVKVLPPTYANLESDKWSCLTFPTNTVIASQSHLPALSMPAGFTDDGLPVGVEVVGKPFSEGALLRFAYAYEGLAKPRRAPTV